MVVQSTVMVPAPAGLCVLMNWSATNMNIRYCSTWIEASAVARGLSVSPCP